MDADNSPTLDRFTLDIEEGARLHPREIKSSSTYSSDMREHLETFCRLAPNAERPLVVYSGETHADVAVNFTDLSDWC